MLRGIASGIYNNFLLPVRIKSNWLLTWTGRYNKFLWMNPSISVEMICALTSHCLYGYHYPWAYECLNNCHITRQCLSSYLTMPHSVLERTYQEVFTSQVSPPLTGPCFPNKEWIQMRMWSWFFFFPFIFISWRLITLQYCSDFCHTLTWIGILILFFFFLFFLLLVLFKSHKTSKNYWEKQNLSWFYLT